MKTLHIVFMFHFKKFSNPEDFVWELYLQNYGNRYVTFCGNIMHNLPQKIQFLKGK